MSEWVDLAFRVLPVAGATQPSPSLQLAPATAFISFPWAAELHKWREAGCIPWERQALGYLIDLLGETLAGGQWENRAAGPCVRMACPAEDQYASANQGAGAGKARSFLGSVCLVEKIDRQIGLRILDIEKGKTSLFAEKHNPSSSDSFKPDCFKLVYSWGNGDY